jgi:alpha-ketoglutarate-dependent taurine dioxygenase
MSIAHVRVAELEKTHGQKIQELEKTLGVQVLGLQSQTPQANLSQEQIERLRKIEDELGVTLVAFERTRPLLSEEQFQQLHATAAELGLTLLPFQGKRDAY